MAQARQLKYSVSNCHEAVVEYARWLNGHPPGYLCIGEMPRSTYIGFDHLISTLGKNPEGERANIHAQHEERMRQRMQ